MEKMLFSLGGTLMGLFTIVNGVLLIFWPKQFLTFHDIWSGGGLKSSWREDVGKIQYKIFGAGLVAFGLLVLRDMLSVLTS